MKAKMNKTDCILDQVQILPQIDYGTKLAAGVSAHTTMPTRRAQFVLALVERWAMVAATDDREDSAGRAALRLMSVSEVVNRAVAISAKTFEAIEEKGWFIEVGLESDLFEEGVELTDKRSNIT